MSEPIKQPKIVVLGGGTGLSVLLRGLRKFEIDITAVVTVADDGGSTGLIREELGIPAPGDIRNVIAALSDTEPLLAQLFSHRFDSELTGTLSGHSLGNLFIAAMTEITGDFSIAVREMSKVLKVKGRVLPSANRSIVLHAEMTDGEIVSGESKIPEANKTIKRVFLTPEDTRPLRRTLRAIREADLIAIGPGSLYTSIIPNLVIPTLSEAICRSKAKKVYICNIMTQHGETINYTASDHMQAIHEHMGSMCVDTILINNEAIPTEIQRKYKEESAAPVEIDCDRLKEMSLNLIEEEIVYVEEGAIRHDNTKIAKILVELLRQ